MLLRISGGVDGIKIYLVTGKKAGRSFSRDELDARVVLTGDLDLTDSIIQSIPEGRERYLHVTIACKEDEVPREMLESIVEDFRQFAFAAYRPDEYSLYAEAHLPKIKSYTNSRTGGRVERKPHIHLVIPRINLLTGQDLNPFELVDRQLKWLSAFQEHVNKKYGLASPKDNRRHRFTGESEMISRYKGDLFVGPHHQLRQQILNDVLNRNITSYQDFQWLLAEYGVVRVRNAGRLNEYLNVKPEGAAKGANLKDAVFSRDFIEAPAEEKRRRLSEMMEIKYEAAGEPQPTEADLLASLDEWRDVRSKELKYLHTGSKFYKQTYLSADDATRHQLIAQLEFDFYSAHGDHDDRATSKPNINDIGRNPPPAARGRLRSLSELGVVHVEGEERAASMLLPSDVPGELESDGAGGDNRVRRPESGQIGRERDSTVTQLAAEAREESLIRKAEGVAEYQEIRRKLDARRLLAFVAASHGVLTSKYEISKARDGSDRIQCGRRHLNVSDFLTKELALPFAEAAPILHECYTAQRATVPFQAALEEQVDGLWADYVVWRDAALQRRSATLQQQRSEHKAQRGEILRQYYTERAGISERLRGFRRRVALAVIRAKRVQAERGQSGSFRNSRAATLDKYPRNDAYLYRQYLREVASSADEKAAIALAELRRQQFNQGDRMKGAYITGGSVTLASSQLLSNLHYRVAENGDVVYDLNGSDVITDHSSCVYVHQPSDLDVIETALKLAVMKFGNRLTLHGEQEFQRSVVDVAIKRGFDIRFTDPELQKLYATGRQSQKRRIRPSNLDM